MSGHTPPWIGGLFVLSSTLMTYTLHRLLGKKHLHPSMSTYRYTFVNDNSRITSGSVVFFGLIALLSFWYLPRPSQIVMVACGILSLSYILPLLGKSRLRDVGILKLVLISIVWGALPIHGFLEASGPSSICWLLLAEHFAFIFALTIPFDLRDQELDKTSEISNLANTVGAERSRYMMIIFFALAGVLSILLYRQGHYTQIGLCSHLIFYMASAVLCMRHRKRSELYFLLILDGLILIKGITLSIS